MLGLTPLSSAPVSDLGGVPDCVASGDATLQSFTAQGVVSQAFEMVGAAVLSTFVAVGSVGHGVGSQAAATLPAFTSDGLVGTTVVSEAAATLQPFTSTGTTAYVVKATGTPALPLLTSTGVAHFAIQAVGTPSLPPFTASAQLAYVVIAQGNVYLYNLESTATGGVPATASGTPTLPLLTANGTAAFAIQATGTPTLGNFVSSCAVGHSQQTGWLSAPGPLDAPAIVLNNALPEGWGVFSVGANVTHMSLAFDQNMRPTLAFTQDGIAKLWWYDTSIPGHTVTEYPGYVTPFVSMDDKRSAQNAVNDILFLYVRGRALYYRQQRDRYETEYWLTDLPYWVENIYSVGMNETNRFQIKFKNFDNPCLQGVPYDPGLLGNWRMLGSAVYGSGGMVFDATLPDKPFTLLSEYTPCTYIRPDTNTLHVMHGDEIKEFDRDPFQRYDLLWRSKVHYLPKPISFTCGQVLLDPESLETFAAYQDAIEGSVELNQTLWNAGGWRAGFNNVEYDQYEWNGSEMTSVPQVDTPLAEITVFADGVAVFSKEISSDTVFRLPGGFRADNWEVAAYGNVPVRRVTLATSVKEIQTT